MRTCVVGAGAVGTVIGARVAAGGAGVSALARGATAERLRADGWRLRERDVVVEAPVAAVSEDPRALGEQDLLVLAVKAHALPELAPSLAPLLGPDTIVLAALNGVPWWFTQGIAGPAHDVHLTSVDPGGVVAAALPPARVAGCVVHLSASRTQEGETVLGGGNHLIVGDAVAGSGHSATVADLLRAAGFEVTHSDDVRADAWFKLWGNLTMNPVSVLTGATMDVILADPDLRAFIARVMGEARTIGERLGCRISQGVEERLEVTARLGSVRTSMLQDAEAGRRLELGALVGAVVELGALVGVPTPWTSSLLGLTRVAADVRGVLA